MPLRLGWHIAVLVLPIWITWKRRMKLPGLDLYRGASTLVWSYGEALAFAGSHPHTVIQTPLRP
jgi:hypothetical protein